jgi:putative SOS response-associated peptidase YedK
MHVLAFLEARPRSVLKPNQRASEFTLLSATPPSARSPASPASTAKPFTVAAIWDRWTDRSTGKIVDSFSMLTINADNHPVMGRFHRPCNEERSLITVPPESWPAWLSDTTDQAAAMLQPMDALVFGAEPAAAAKKI